MMYGTGKPANPAPHGRETARDSHDPSTRQNSGSPADMAKEPLPTTHCATIRGSLDACDYQARG